MEQATLLLIYELLDELAFNMMVSSYGLTIGVVVMSLSYSTPHRRRMLYPIITLVIAFVVLVLSAVAFTLGWDNIHEGLEVTIDVAFFMAGGMAITGAILYRGEIPTADEANNDMESPDDKE